VKDQRVSVQFRCIQNSEKGQFPAYLKTPAVSQHIPLAIVPVLLQQMVSLKGQEEEKLEMKKLGEKRRPNLGSRSLTQPRLEKQTADKGKYPNFLDFDFHNSNLAAKKVQLCCHV